VTAASIVEPQLLFLFFFITVPASVLVVLGALNGARHLLQLRDELPRQRARALIALLVLVVLTTILGTVSSCVHSLGLRSKSGLLVSEYPISIVAAPVAFAATCVAALRALSALTPRRIATLGVTAALGWPLLLAVRTLEGPLIDIDELHLVLAPWAVDLYGASVGAIIASAIALMVQSHRVAARSYGSVPPPQARVV